MRMQLRVRRLSARDTPRGRVPVGGRDQILRGLLDDLGPVAAANDRHPLTQIADRALDRPRVRCLDLLTLPRVTQRPHDRHRLRGAERHIDPATPRTVRARPAQPPAGPRVPAIHQRDEIPARPPAQPGRRPDGPTCPGPRASCPAPPPAPHRALGSSPRARGRPSCPPDSGRNPRPCRHRCSKRSSSTGTDPKRPKPANEFDSDRTAPAPLCILCVCVCGWALSFPRRDQREQTRAASQDASVRCACRRCRGRGTRGKAASVAT